MIIIISIAIGLVVGSFLNVVILRADQGESLGGRSRCDSCRKTLSAGELIPIVSFVIQKARCRSCGIALSWQYPLVESATAAGYGAAAWILAPDITAISAYAPGLAVAFIGIAALVVILVADFRFQIIPDGAAVALLIAGIAVSAMRHSFFPDAAAGFAIALFFAALWFFSRGRWMGLGDAKLILATSLATGFPASIAGFVFSFWIGGASALPLLLFGGKSMHSRIPFGPFIIAGAAAAYFFSDYFFRAAGLSLLW